jgi:hypothetical protein
MQNEPNFSSRNQSFIFLVLSRVDPKGQDPSARGFFAALEWGEIPRNDAGSATPHLAGARNRHRDCSNTADIRIPHSARQGSQP